MGITLAERREKDLLFEINRLRRQLWAKVCVPSSVPAFNKVRTTASFKQLPNFTSENVRNFPVKSDPHVVSGNNPPIIKVNVEEEKEPCIKVESSQKSYDSNKKYQKKRQRTADFSDVQRKKPKKEADEIMGETVFPCALCPAVFPLRCKLSTHIRKHTDYKPYTLADRYNLPCG